jgi:hypothetical protein
MFSNCKNKIRFNLVMSKNIFGTDGMLPSTILMGIEIAVGKQLLLI